MDTTTREDGRRDPGGRRNARGVAGLRLAALALALALGPLGCSKPSPPRSAVPAPKAKAKASAKPWGEARESSGDRRAGARNESTAQFVAFALNALLVPLLDDDLPPRWADPSLSFDCDAGTVTVDDAPLDIGAPVPGAPFTVRWHMERCTPFDDAMQLSGDIELKVEPSGAGYRAVVRPVAFRVLSARGDDVLTEPFTARMGVGR